MLVVGWLLGGVLFIVGDEVFVMVLASRIVVVVDYVWFFIGLVC